MADNKTPASDTPDRTAQGTSPNADDSQEAVAIDKPKPGQYAQHWYSPYGEADCSEALKKKMKELVDVIGNKDVAARRWEVEQAWESRLMDRGYQYLLPGRNGGWIIPGFGNKEKRRRNLETNIYNTYGNILTAALTRDIPGVRFMPRDPSNDADVTAAGAATKYAKCFSQSNDLTNFQHQLVYYLRNDGRSVIVADYVLDGQRFGWDPIVKEAVPENEQQLSNALVYLVRHGETDRNAEDKTRGQDPVELNNQGEQQADETGDFLAKKGVKRLVTSPMPRAMQSAQAISGKTGLQAEPDERFSALDVGDFTDQPKEQADPQIAEYFDNPEEPIPGSSEPTTGDFSNRIQDGLFDYMRQAESGQGPVAIAMHDSGITQAAKLITGDEDMSPDVVQPGGVIAICPAEGGGYVLKAVFGQVSPSIEMAQDRTPRGQEVAECFGKLEAKVPINAQTPSDCSFVQVSKEYDVSFAKAMFPDHADEIRPGNAGAGENELDRIARINAMLALQASYVTGDSMVRDCTVQRTWMRPSFFYEIDDKTLRQEALEKFPDGALVIMAGQCVVSMRNECLDDHITIVHAFPGSGQNRISLLDPILSVQKRLNNWMDLLNAFFVKTVAMRWFNANIFDIEQIKQQGNEPGGVGAFLPPPNLVSRDQAMIMEDTPTHQPAFPEFIQLFINDLPQLLSGAVASLFGSDSNTDTATGIAIQRDQALGRLGTPWHAIQVATCNYFRQAVQLAARCRKSKVSASLPGGEVVNIELADLKGSVLAYPEQDSNFPESWNQKQQRLQQLLTDATNPLVQGWLALAKNQRFMRDSLGLSDVEVPAATAYEKQLGEMKVLLNSSPVPNPDYQAAQQTLQKAGVTYQSEMAAKGGMRDAQAEASLQQAGQQIKQMPPLVSTVPVNPILPAMIHDAEASACLDWMMSPEGRAYMNGTQQERAGFMNVSLHWQETMKASEAQKAKDEATQPVKPPSKSISIDKLPPVPAAALARQAGIPAQPQDFAAQEMIESPSAR